MRHLFIHEGRLYRELRVGETRKEGAIFYSVDCRWEPSSRIGKWVTVVDAFTANPVPLPEGCELVPPEEYGPTWGRIPEDYFWFSSIRGEWRSQASVKSDGFVWFSDSFFARPKRSEKLSDERDLQGPPAEKSEGRCVECEKPMHESSDGRPVHAECARKLPRWKRIFHGYEPPANALESLTRAQRVMLGFEDDNEACDDRPSNLEWAQGIGASAPPPPPIAMDDAAGDDVARDLTNEELVAFRRQNPTSTKE